MSLAIVILAAGCGKRMYSELPKMLHPIGGKPILKHVLETAETLNDKIYVVCGYQSERIKAAIPDQNITWVKQAEQLGTGHAVLQALPHISADDRVLILVGDCPLITSESLKKLIDSTPIESVGLMTTEFADPTGYGRIHRDTHGNILGIIEQKDATPEELLIKEVNSGVMLVPAKYLKSWLPALKNDNAQAEYLLTDIFKMATSENRKINIVKIPENEEILGVNDRQQLSVLERCYQHRIAKQLMKSGVTLIDPARLDVRGELKAEPDVVIDVNNVFEGVVSIGHHTKIGPNCFIKDATIGANVEIFPNTVIDGAIIEDNCSVGPFTRIRPKTVLKSHSKVGNFVELKKTILGEGSKAAHLSYLGDAIIGKEVNIGCGTITCNYDGISKYTTIIGDHAFIGSDSQLIAPVRVGEGAYIGSGSTISRDAPPHQLTVCRAKQVSIPNWKPKKKEDISEP